MIKIKVIYENGTIREIRALGHAESAPYGKDLVCAAISAILWGGFNALSDRNYRFERDQEQGLGGVTCLAEPSSRDQVVLETIVTQIESVALSNPKHVTLERK